MFVFLLLFTLRSHGAKNGKRNIYAHTLGVYIRLLKGAISLTTRPTPWYLHAVRRLLWLLPLGALVQRRTALVFSIKTHYHNTLLCFACWLWLCWLKLRGNLLILLPLSSTHSHKQVGCWSPKKSCFATFTRCSLWAGLSLYRFAYQMCVSVCLYLLLSSSSIARIYLAHAVNLFRWIVLRGAKSKWRLFCLCSINKIKFFTYNNTTLLPRIII